MIDDFAIDQDTLNQISEGLDNLAEVLGNVMASLIKAIGQAADIATKMLAGWVDAYREAWNMMPNNWLKMHGYPMRRRYVCKHTNQKRRRK